MAKRKKLSWHAAQVKAQLLANDPTTCAQWGEYELSGSLADRMEEIVYNHGYATSAMLLQGDVERARAVRYRLEKEFWELAKHEGLVELLEAAWAAGLSDGSPQKNPDDTGRDWHSGDEETPQEIINHEHYGFWLSPEGECFVVNTMYGHGLVARDLCKYLLRVGEAPPVDAEFYFDELGWLRCAGLPHAFQIMNLEETPVTPTQAQADIIFDIYRAAANHQKAKKACNSIKRELSSLLERRDEGMQKNPSQPFLTLCSWCQGVIFDGPPGPRGEVSHGICYACAVERAEEFGLTDEELEEILEEQGGAKKNLAAQLPSIIYHGTSSDEEFDIPDGPGWFTDEPEAAKFYAEGGYTVALGRPRVLSYTFKKKPKLLHLSDGATPDMLVLADLWEAATGDRLSLKYTDSGSDLLEAVYVRAEDRMFSASVICRGGYDGWIVPGVLEDNGADIMLCDPKKLLKPAGEFQPVARENPAVLPELPVAQHREVFHVGAEPSGAHPKRSAMSYEGPGLSVSIHPEAWRKIARLGGAPVWRLRRADGTKGQFVNMKKLLRDEVLVAALLDEARARGLVEGAGAYRLTYRDGETGRRAYMDFATEAAAQENREEFGGTVKLVAAFRALPTLQQWWREFFTKDVPDSFAREAAIIAVLHGSGLDGLWWPDRLNVLHLSAPRGVIFPAALSLWTLS